MTIAKVNLQQLRHFVSAAELGTFSKAAESLRVSQPTITISIAKLEKAIGAELFHRDHSGVHVTPAGHILLSNAKDVLCKIETTVKSIAGLQKADAKARRNVVKLGLMPQIAQVLLTPLVEQRMHRYPNIDLVIQESPGTKLIKMLETGEIDLAISNVAASGKSIIAEPIVVQEFYLMGSSKLLKDGSPIRFVDLGDCPLIQGAMDGSMERRLTLETLAAANKIRLNFDVNSPVTIRKQLIQTLGRYSVSLYFLFMQEISDGEITARPIRNPTLVQYLYLMRRKQKVVRSAETVACNLVKSQIGRMIKQSLYRWHKPDWRRWRDAVELDAIHANRR